MGYEIVDFGAILNAQDVEDPQPVRHFTREEVQEAFVKLVPKGAPYDQSCLFYVTGGFSKELGLRGQFAWRKYLLPLTLTQEATDPKFFVAREVVFRGEGEARLGYLSIVADLSEEAAAKREKGQVFTQGYRILERDSVQLHGDDKRGELSTFTYIKSGKGVEVKYLKGEPLGGRLTSNHKGARVDLLIFDILPVLRRGERYSYQFGQLTVVYEKIGNQLCVREVDNSGEVIEELILPWSPPSLSELEEKLGLDLKNQRSSPETDNRWRDIQQVVDAVGVKWTRKADIPGNPPMRSAA